MKKTKYEILQCGKYYHIHNRGTNSCNLFRENENYEHFLRLFDRYIIPVAECYAWALLGNHFHIMVKIKSKSKILKYQKIARLTKMTAEGRVYQQFSNLFNAYTKSFNKKFERSGSLFEHPFHRKCVEGKAYFLQLILYIHTNPVRHKFCDHPLNYPWTSFIDFLSKKPSRIKKTQVFDWFDQKTNFEAMHKQMVELIHLEDLNDLS